MNCTAAAEYLGIHRNTLHKWRRAGKGPPWTRPPGKCPKYDPTQLERWKTQWTHPHQSTE